MSLITVLQQNALLTYDISTSPDPLQVSTSTGEAPPGSIDIVVSNGGASPQSIRQIQVQFDVGPGAQQLTDISTGISSAASPSDQWTFVANGSTPGSFTASPITGSAVTFDTNGLALHLGNLVVNDQVGSFTLTIIETDNGGSTRTNQYRIGKFPGGFFVANFRPDRPEINQGDTVTLTWVGSEAATYTLQYGSTSPQVVQGRSKTITGLQRDTTFILSASAVVEDETVEYILTTSVSVVAAPAVPSGTIVLWYGSMPPPSGWALCNGNNGTPNLLDRFVVGTDTVYTAQDSRLYGEPTQHIHYVNPRTVDGTTYSESEHTHNVPLNDDSQKVDPDGKSSTHVADNVAIQTGPGSAHSHDFELYIPSFYTQDQVKTDHSNLDEIRPKWCALCYIMKL